MRKLKGAVPRAYPDHRRADARRYTELLRAVTARLGLLPRAAAPTLREYGRTALGLEDLAEEYATARARRRLTEMRRIRREQSRLRLTMLGLERRLEQLAGVHREAMDPLEALMAEDR